MGEGGVGEWGEGTACGGGDGGSTPSACGVHQVHQGPGDGSGGSRLHAGLRACPRLACQGCASAAQALESRAAGWAHGPGYHEEGGHRGAYDEAATGRHQRAKMVVCVNRKAQ